MSKMPCGERNFDVDFGFLAGFLVLLFLVLMVFEGKNHTRTLEAIETNCQPVAEAQAEVEK